MREAIGSSLLFNLIIVFIVLMIAFLAGSLSYSKAFKVKNRIIDIIEKNEGYTDESKKEINESLGNMGYRVSSDKNCGPDDISGNTSYEYCVYEYTQKEGSKYYKVTTYMYFDIPVIGGLLHFPVSGETKILNYQYVNYVGEE